MGSSPGFGSVPCDWAGSPAPPLRERRPLQTRFPSASRLSALKLATPHNSPAHSSIGTPSGLPLPEGSGIALRLLVGTRVHVLFHSPPGVLFTIPSLYSSAIGRQGSLALEGSPPSFPRGSSCPVVLRCVAQRVHALSPTGLSPSVAGRSRTVRLTRGLLTPRPGRSPAQPRPSTPAVQRLRACPHLGFGLLPFRSPLLRESRLISLPPGTEMFQFPDWPCPCLWVQHGTVRYDPHQVSPFGHDRLAGCLAPPRSFRRRQRPSSALGARASTVCLS